MVTIVAALGAAASLSAVMSPVMNNVAQQAFKILEKRRDMSSKFYINIDHIRESLGMLSAEMKDQQLETGNPSYVKIQFMEYMRDLSYDIEDCLDRILCCSECGGHPDRDSELLEEVDSLMERLKLAAMRKAEYKVNDNKSGTVEEEPSTFSKNTFNPVGIDDSKKELHEVLMGHPEQLNVISIVGFEGSGKTTLAKEVFSCPDITGQFPCRAWVAASEHMGDVKGLLAALFEKLRIRPGRRAKGGATGLQADIASYLNNRRYLIVLDDITEQQWVNIKSIFPEKTRSRIIVTTTIQSLAELCCNHVNNGYVYNIRTLDEKHSEDLLNTVLNNRLSGLDQSSRLIVNKCDGHPLALLSVANYLMRKPEFTETDCNFFFSVLGSLVEKEAFRELEKVLMRNYRTLPVDPVNLRTCILYTCVFRNGHPISRTRLMSRWLAEGYVQESNPWKARLVAEENLKELIDRNIIRPIDPSKYAKVKTCRAHGIMHEFMMRMSHSTNFITSLGDPERRKYRHLFTEERPSTSNGRTSNQNHGYSSQAKRSKSKDGKNIFKLLRKNRKINKEKEEKYHARSLTICGSAGEAAMHFPKCELLRVLDMEECDDLKDMGGIHKLWHLRYLSLGPTISCLPSEIDKLYCLETLDMRKSKIKEVPVEVIRLPHIAHLLGKFKLEKDWRKKKLEKFLPEQSNLQTLAGFVTDDNPGFPNLMVHMKKLRKVKIWCSSTRNDSKLSEAIENFVRPEMDTGIGVRSLSLNLGSSSRDILDNFLEPSSGEGYLSSLKLHGALHGLTRFVKLLCGLKELCLSSTNDLTSDELSILRTLECLEYLKLVNISLRDLVIRKGDFPRLMRLCLVQCHPLPTIEPGALPKLLSLRILSEDLVLYGSSGINIKEHALLRELALDSNVTLETLTSWEDAAKDHPKRPRVLFFQRGPDGTEDTVKYVPTKRPASASVPRASPRVCRISFLFPFLFLLLWFLFYILPPSLLLYLPPTCSDPRALYSNIGDEPGTAVEHVNVGPNNGDFLRCSAPRADDHGKMKEYNNHNTCDQDDGEDKNYKSSPILKAVPGLMIKEPTAKGTLITTAGGKGKGKGKVDEITETAAIQLIQDKDSGNQIMVCMTYNIRDAAAVEAGISDSEAMEPKKWRGDILKPEDDVFLVG